MDKVAQEPPSQTDGIRTVTVVSWNIFSDQNAEYQIGGSREGDGIAERGLRDHAGDQVDPQYYTWPSAGYRVIAMEVVSASQGGVALFWRESNFLEVEEVVKHDPNIITVQVVTAVDQFYIVGCYPPQIRPHGDEWRRHVNNVQRVAN